MTHVSLDAQDEAVKQFVLGLTADPNGSMLELNGQPVACLVPPPKARNGGEEPEWTDAKNTRRVELIKKKHAGGLSPAEHVELGGLQEEMLRFRQKVAPLPLEDARRLHQELLARGGRSAIAPMTIPFLYPPSPHVRCHGPAGYADHASYRPWLRDEFSFRCVYCLLREQWGRVGGVFDVDHFLPVVNRPDLATD